MKRGRPAKNGDAVRPKTLAQLGMTKRQSSEWQKLAQIPDAEFEAMLKGQQKPSTGSLIGEWHGRRERRIASLERMAAELRAAGWIVFPPPASDA